MVSHPDQSTAETPTTVRTLIELRESEDGVWVATQPDVAHEGTGDTGALAVMDYCRRISRSGEIGDDPDCV